MYIIYLVYDSFSYRLPEIFLSLVLYYGQVNIYLEVQRIYLSASRCNEFLGKNFKARLILFIALERGRSYEKIPLRMCVCMEGLKSRDPAINLSPGVGYIADDSLRLREILLACAKDFLSLFAVYFYIYIFNAYVAQAIFQDFSMYNNNNSDFRLLLLNGISRNRRI